MKDLPRTEGPKLLMFQRQHRRLVAFHFYRSRWGILQPGYMSKRCGRRARPSEASVDEVRVITDPALDPAEDPLDLFEPRGTVRVYRVIEPDS